MIQKRARWTISAVAASGLLIAGIAAGGSAAPTSHPKTKPAASVTGQYANLDACPPILAEGYHGGCAAQVQADLDAVLPPSVLPTKLPPDGDFGPATEKAVEAFQEEHQISPMDGKVGSVTKAALDSAIGGPVGSAPGPGGTATQGTQPSSQDTPVASGGTPVPTTSQTPGAGNVLAPGLTVVTSPPNGNSGSTVRHAGDKLFGDKECSATVPFTSNVQVCEHIGGDIVISDYAAPSGHNEFITRMGAEFISAQSVHNPWIDFDYYGTNGQHIYHWQGPPHATSHEYLRRVYTPIAGNYYDFAAAGNLCATLYDNPGQAPVEITRACVSVGPQS